MRLRSALLAASLALLAQCWGTDAERPPGAVRGPATLTNLLHPTVRDRQARLFRLSIPATRGESPDLDDLASPVTTPDLPVAADPALLSGAAGPGRARLAASRDHAGGLPSRSPPLL